MMQRTSKDLMRVALLKAMSYAEYRELIGQLADLGKSTGLEQSEVLSNYTQLNHKRMKRWDKTLKLDEASLKVIESYRKRTTWLVLTESWCGDASPSMPVMNKIAELNANIAFKILLRDENLDLMNHFLTNGSMSIPKLIAIDDQTGEVRYTWGPRSANATKLVEAHKAEHEILTADFKQDLQIWYNNDKGQSVLEDLMQLLLK